MIVWSAVLFFLGIAAFMDALFNYGEIFRQVNSVLFLLMSLAILVRTTTKMKEAKRENLAMRLEELEQKVANLTAEKEQREERSLY